MCMHRQVKGKKVIIIIIIIINSFIHHVLFLQIGAHIHVYSPLQTKEQNQSKNKKTKKLGAYYIIYRHTVKRIA